MNQQVEEVKMKIKLGLRGNSDAVNHIIIKMDDLTLITADNIFLIGEENRNTSKNTVILIIFWQVPFSWGA